MKKILKELLILIILLSSCNLINHKDLEKLSKIDFTETNEKLKSDRIGFELNNLTKNGKTKKELKVLIINTKQVKIDFKKMNFEFFRIIEKSKVNVKMYDEISFWYISDYNKAKLRVAYKYNGNKKLIEVIYK